MFHLTDRQGATQEDTSVEGMRALLESLDIDDPEHPDVSLEHETGWCLSAFPSGLLVWDNVEEDDPPKHMPELSRERVLELWQMLAAGDIESISSQPWLDGYGGNAG